MPRVAHPDTDADRLFRRNLTTVRQANGLSYERVARLVADQGLHMPPTSFWKVEKQGRAVSLGEAVTICRALEVDLSEMYSREVTITVTISASVA